MKYSSIPILLILCITHHHLLPVNGQQPVVDLSSSAYQQQQQQQQGQQPNTPNNPQQQQYPQDPNQPNQQQQQQAYPGGIGSPISSFNNPGTRLDVQLRAYSNGEFRIGGGGEYSCKCPVNPPAVHDACVMRSPSLTDFTCVVSFMVVVASAEGPVHYRSTPLVVLDERGGIRSSSLPAIQQPMLFELDSRPVSIDVLVLSQGAVISSSGQLEHPNQVTLMDTFTISSNQLSAPIIAGGGASPAQVQSHNLKGSLAGSQLQVAFSSTCRSSQLIGPGCDLHCNSSTVNSASAICVNVRTGFFSQCRYSGGGSGASKQVTDCRNCPWGVRENAYCRDETGGVLEAQHTGVVAEGFQTATIVLAVVAALLAVSLLGLCIYTCRGAAKGVGGGRTSSGGATTAPGYNSGYRTTTGEAETAPMNNSGVLIKSPTSRNNTLSTNASFTPPPMAAPRYAHVPPPLASRPNKPAIRSPAQYYQLPPPAHLGGATSLNDTLNSSFAGSQAPPLPPSISADV